ncbi:plant intracellular Ras-group-related LRR protein 5-like [Patiria miniata]|uniref:Disease resistance R13L4/SHOC-2-like LRR domain-containing protein n=1 Tax=Patiria miniata TaxID=46514 RepID=A0A914ASH9_PATMI|nr:plant intracellular Ras-group-related LRR protein 5-like [Patiria miniata]
MTSRLQSRPNNTSSDEAFIHLRLKEARVSQYLCLNNVRLARIPNELISKVTSLRYLYLSNCKLRGPLPSCLTRLMLLETLDISQNAISDIPGYVCEGLPHLVTLDLSFNKLVTLPKSIGGMQCLQELSAAHNRIVVLPSQIGDLSKLRVVDLTGNLLRSIPGEVFAGGLCHSLLILKLGGNLLKTLPPEAGLLCRLEELDLSENCCCYLPSTMRSLRRLKAFHHSGNDWMMFPPHIPGVPAKDQSSFGCKALEKLYSYMYVHPP